MAKLYIDDAARRKIVARWVVICLFFLHVWGIALVLSAIFSDMSSGRAEVIGGMFSTVSWSIFAILLLLLVDRAGDVIIDRIGGFGGNMRETLKTERVVETASPAPADAA